MRPVCQAISPAGRHPAVRFMRAQQKGEARLRPDSAHIHGCLVSDPAGGPPGRKQDEICTVAGEERRFRKKAAWPGLRSNFYLTWFRQEDIDIYQYQYYLIITIYRIIVQNIKRAYRFWNCRIPGPPPAAYTAAVTKGFLSAGDMPHTGLGPSETYPTPPPDTQAKISRRSM